MFHLAAQPGVRGSWGRTFDVYLRDNLLATQRVFEAAAQRGVRVVFASSSSVYGNAATLPDVRGHAAAAGVAVRRHEALLRAPRRRLRGRRRPRLRRPCATSPSTVRASGPTWRSGGSPSALAEGGTFVVYGTGEQSRDVTYVDDAVLATIAAMDAAAPGRGLQRRRRQRDVAARDHRAVQRSQRARPRGAASARGRRRRASDGCRHEPHPRRARVAAADRDRAGTHGAPQLGSVPPGPDSAGLTPPDSELFRQSSPVGRASSSKHRRPRECRGSGLRLMVAPPRHVNGARVA